MIVIIGVLAGLVVFAMRSSITKAKDARAKEAVRSVQNALDTYLLDHKDTFSALGTSLTLSSASTIQDANNVNLLNSVPQDGQGKPLVVTFSGDNEYTICAATAGKADQYWYYSTKTGSTGGNLDAAAVGTCPPN